MKIIILKLPYSAAEICETICNMAERLEYEIAGIVSFDKRETLKSIKDYPIRSPLQIYDLSWDIAICTYDAEDFKNLLPRMIELGIGTREQFKDRKWLLLQLMIRKYEDFADPVIQETLAYWKTHELSVFNQHVTQDNPTLDRLFFDEACELPYVQFKTVGGDYRRMYYPKEFCANIHDGEKYICDLMEEQLPTSPHLYITDKHKICAGDVVIDAGVREGNFALRYVDICSKMYLFEPAQDWQEPLYQTFKDYRDKVEIIPRFVSDITSGNHITIDDALPDLRDKNIFLKMDVEGAEPQALRGAKKLLTNNKVRASVCTYHNADDLIKVKSILQQYGFRTATSAGYMVFLCDPKIWDTADFRKGIVYAEN